MFNINPIFAIDFYKVDHRRQYPEGTTEIYSNFTPRYYKKSHSLLSDYDEQIVIFGIQGFLQSFFIEQWKSCFFKQPKHIVISEYKKQIEICLNIKDFDCTHLEALHDLGYLPIRIKAIPEGCRVPIGVPVLTIVNTHPDFFWLTNYLETAISASLWKAMTTATIAFEFKRLLTKYALKTGAELSGVMYQVHDFSFRGMSGIDDAIVSGAAHLTSFDGTDCVPAINYLNMYYNAHSIGASVPATEHSVMCCDGVGGEFATIRRLITEVYPSGIVSIVCDSYNFWDCLTIYIVGLYAQIKARNGKVVIRPDSGNPVDIICGDILAEAGSPAFLGALQVLWDIFGGTTNSQGYKELDSHIGLIYGDAITVQRASLMLQIMQEKGFASSNIVFGVGSYSYQYVTRDTFGFAMKATSCVVNGQRRAIFKDPITATDNNKKNSAKGLLRVDYDEKQRLKVEEDVCDIIEQKGCLQTVFEDGKLINAVDFADIRINLQRAIDNLID